MSRHLLFSLSMIGYWLAVVLAYCRQHKLLYRYSMLQWGVLGIALGLQGILFGRWFSSAAAPTITWWMLMSWLVWMGCSWFWLSVLFKKNRLQRQVCWVPLMAVISICAYTFPAPLIVYQGMHPVLLAHVLLGIVCLLSILLLVFLQCCWLVQEHVTRYVPACQWLRYCPSLEQSECRLFQLITATWLLLTLLIMTSSYCFYNQLVGSIVLRVKFFSAVCAWGILSVVCLGRLVFGWRARAVSYSVGISFLCLSLVYFLSRSSF